MTSLRRWTHEIVHVDVGGLCEHTPTLQQKAELPGSPTPLALRLVDNHRVQQSTSSDLFDERRVERTNPRAEFLPEDLCAFGQALVDKNVESGGGNGASQRVAVGDQKRSVDCKGFLPSVRTPVLSGLDAEHDFLVSQHGRHGIH